jgi:signal transduction histidine kinase
MSHELRTPLNHIIGYNDLLLEGTFGGLDGEQADVLQRVQRSSRSLLALIEATLDLSRLDNKRAPLDVSAVSVADFMDELADRTRRTCERPDLSLRWAVEPNLTVFWTDAVKLQMILRNLVENAIKFTERGSVVVEVRPHREGVEFAVTDTGIGIPVDLRGAIFEPFRRGHAFASYDGLGLGLHIVQRLVDALGGSISVESEVGTGSCFLVRLPRIPAPPAATDGHNDHGQSPLH